MTNLTNGVNGLNGTGLAPLQSLVAQIQPILQNIEFTIDQFGADFSVQNVVNQTSEYVRAPYKFSRRTRANAEVCNSLSIQNILSLVEDGNGNVQKLKNLNKANQVTVNSLINAAETSMNQLAAAAQQASTIANSPPDIPPSQFNGIKGTACNGSTPA